MDDWVKHSLIWGATILLITIVISLSLAYTYTNCDVVRERTPGGRIVNIERVCHNE